MKLLGRFLLLLVQWFGLFCAVYVVSLPEFVLTMIGIFWIGYFLYHIYCNMVAIKREIELALLSS